MPSIQVQKAGVLLTTIGPAKIMRLDHALIAELGSLSLHISFGSSRIFVWESRKRVGGTLCILRPEAYPIKRPFLPYRSLYIAEFHRQLQQSYENQGDTGKLGIRKTHFSDKSR